MASLLLQNVGVAARLSACFLNCSAGPRSFFSSWLLGRTQLSRPSQAVTATQPHGTDLLPFLTSGPLSSLQHVAGMKCKVVLRKRCKDCFIVRRRGRLYVYCKTHPRHKQRQF